MKTYIQNISSIFLDFRKVFKNGQFCEDILILILNPRMKIDKIETIGRRRKKFKNNIFLNQIKSSLEYINKSKYGKVRIPVLIWTEGFWLFLLGPSCIENVKKFTKNFSKKTKTWRCHAWYYASRTLLYNMLFMHNFMHYAMHYVMHHVIHQVMHRVMHLILYALHDA